MYQEEYKRWLEADLEDADLSPELARIEGNDCSSEVWNSRTSWSSRSRNESYEYLCSTSGNTGTG